jgi:hypothetical protein
VKRPKVVTLPDPKVLKRIRELGGTWPLRVEEYLEMLEARRG